MNIPCDFTGWVQTIGTSGSINITNGIATISGVSGDSTKMERNILVGPGATVEVRIMAKALSGVGQLAIDFLPIDRGGDVINVASTEWREYTLSFTTPLTAPDNQKVTFVIGSFSTNTGSAVYQEPRISVTNGALGAPRVLAQGAIVMNSGVPSQPNNYQTSGISAMSYSAANKELTLTLRTIENVRKMYPMFFLQLTQDATDVASLKLSLKIGKYDGATGQVPIKFVDSSTGTFVDVATYTGLYFFFMAVV